MNQIVPNELYEDQPCSVVAIGCAMGGNVLPVVRTKEDGYATLRDINVAVRENLQVARYNYYPRETRPNLWQLMQERKKGRAVVCVLGHYVYCDFGKSEYYSFFDNAMDRVVAVWELV